MSNKYFEVTDRLIDNVSIIRITDGEFEGVEFTFGSVAVEPDGDSARLKFEYNIVTGEHLIDPLDRFKNLICDILTDIMYDQLDKEEVIYKGGK